MNVAGVYLVLDRIVDIQAGNLARLIVQSLVRGGERDWLDYQPWRMGMIWISGVKTRRPFTGRE